MHPRLIAISGPLEGQTFPLHGESLRIGRHSDNDLQVPSLEISRHHCEVRCTGPGAFEVVDLDSRHGVFVNSRPVRRRDLAHSDLLTLGATALLFLLDDSSSDAATTSPSSSPRPSFVAHSTLERKASELLYLNPSRVEAALPAQARIGRHLHSLLRAATSLQGSLELPELGRRLVTAARESVPAEALSVLLAQAGSDGLALLASWPASARPESCDPDPRAVARMRSERVGLLMAEPGNDAALLTPLVGHGGELLGAVYAYSPRPRAFDEDHLELLGALSGIASMAFQNALHWQRLRGENQRLRKDQLGQPLVGETPAMEKLLDLVARVARAETTVLIRGESGTGKELVAQAIHQASDRAEGPFLAINCATLSETLAESELFGHEKGAFTGAVARVTGKIEAAAGGTLFLDEVGEIPPGLQAKLLRVLQERQFTRVGSTRPIAADVRLLAATNRDLEAAIRDGSFRQDLYYRLKVIALEVPPLRLRKDDIPLLARHFLSLHGRRLGRPGVGLSPAARRCLLAYAWPGNVRELGNVIERALVLGESDTVQPEDLPDEVVEGAAEIPSSFQAALHDLKTRLVLDAYRQGGGDYGTAADLLGIHVNSLHRLIRRLGIKERLGR